MTKAIHIEVKSLTTEAFLAALRRFIARRGKPKTLYSYDVTNFKVHLLNSMKYTTCINLHHKWQDYMIFWQLNDVTWDSFPAWTPLRRIMGSSEIHEKSLAKNIRCTHGHLRRTLLLTGWDRGMPEFQTLVCPIKRSSQPNIFVSWTFSDCWTINPVTLCWLY